MSDFKRIQEIYSDYANSLRKEIPENINPRNNTVEMLALSYWFQGLRQRTGLKTAYALELYFEKESFRRNSNGTIRHYRSKWSRYEQNMISPKAKTLSRVELLAPGSTRDLNHPLWTLMKQIIQNERIDFDGYFRTLSIDIQLVLFSNSSDVFWDSSRREPTTQLLLDKLERRASIDSLSALIAIVVEANHLRRKSLAVKAASSLHRVLLMLAMELQARGVAICLTDWLAINVLPLGTPDHLQVCMTSTEYIYASAHLNTMVYQHPQRRGRSLPWKQRTKIMLKLIAGDMGFDVMHAMRPEYELRTDIGDISGDLIQEFKKMSALRNWGWKCIIDGTPQVTPPTSF